MNKQNNPIDKLIDSYLDGNLDDLDCAALIDWINKDKQNSLYFRNYCTRWQPVHNNTVETSWNVLKVRRQLRSNANELDQKTKRIRRSGVLNLRRAQVLKYASILVMGIFTLLYSYERIQERSPDPDKMNWVLAETQPGQKAKIMLPDSSMVWLNSDSKLAFPSDFETGKERTVELVGEAYFEVMQMKRSTFKVHCADYDIEVKGTKFNVMAYEDFKRTETTLIEGAVNIVKGDKLISLRPGERAVFSGNSITLSKALTRQATVWKENKFYFDNVPFRELIRRLERWYDVKINLKDPSLNDIYYSGYFKNEETVWQVLDVISMTTPITYERNQFREISIERNSEQNY